ncbi:hypothetical protein GGS24DRAFT_456713 [Hypoxylon argillaceum]|nr:hypothetical protein GGS24DRAFT_456713 [Hypoxylon argillaceum]KAI1155310.1 hypothetical protein F4825DRAFT_70016 [Nemania diffusa]
MSFPFNQLPAELRLEIWGFAVRAGAQRRRVVEQNFQVFPTLDLVASPLLSVNMESREVARAFYRVQLEVYRRVSYSAGGSGSEGGGEEDADARQQQQQQQQQRYPDSHYRGVVYLSPEADDMVSVYRLAAALDDSELSLSGSERSKRTARHHRTRRMSEATRGLFRRHPDRWCLTRYASAHLGAQDWADVHEWMLAFGDDEYRGARRLLRSMRINTAGFAQVFGWQ